MGVGGVGGERSGVGDCEGGWVWDGRGGGYPVYVLFYFFGGGGDWRSMFATNFLSYDVRGRASWVQIIMWESFFFLGGGGGGLAGCVI